VRSITNHDGCRQAVHGAGCAVGVDPYENNPRADKWERLPNVMKPLRTRPMKSAATGFTLIEMMVVVAVVAILAMIAMPIYSDQLRKSRRSTAEAFMMDVVARQQQFLLDRRTYASSITETPALNGLGVPVPASVSTYYGAPVMVTNNANPPPTFVLTLTPIGDQASDKCRALSITEAGQKSASGTGTCW
jgi:type IV pilus assembly protein PilE